MSKKIYTLCFILMTSILYCQTIKIKKNIVLVDDKEYLKLENCGMFNEGGCSLKNLKNEEIIFITSHKFPPDPSYTFSKVKFLGLDKSIEIRESIKGIIKILVKNNAIDNFGNLDSQSVQIIVDKFGNEISIK